MASNAEIDLASSYVRELLAVPEDRWIKADLRKSKIGLDGSITDLISFALLDAKNCWNTLKHLGRGANPQLELDRIGVTVVDAQSGLLDEHFIHFAVFVPGSRTVEQSKNAVERVKKFIFNYQLLDIVGQVDVGAVVLWHEYYHARKSEYFNKNKGLHRRTMRRNQTRIQEEIGAVQFSKLAAGINYNPQIFQWMLVYTVSPMRAVKWMNDIVEKDVTR